MILAVDWASDVSVSKGIATRVRRKRRTADIREIHATKENAGGLVPLHILGSVEQPTV
jgi:hypothetical protein